MQSIDKPQKSRHLPGGQFGLRIACSPRPGSGLLSSTMEAEARNILRYLVATQLAAGNWSQNQWLGGQPYWHGDQFDKTASSSGRPRTAAH
ncbi:MAG: hypothetical protein ABJB17_04395, partial [Burkholderiales bacterium]